jgi:transcriptional regulator with XRE-family HTH domain
MDTSNPVGDRLRLLREQACLSQVSLAALAGCSVSSVSLAERGGFLSHEIAERIASALGCSVDTLVGRDQE